MQIHKTRVTSKLPLGKKDGGMGCKVIRHRFGPPVAGNAGAGSSSERAHFLVWATLVTGCNDDPGRLLVALCCGVAPAYQTV